MSRPQPVAALECWTLTRSNATGINQQTRRVANAKVAGPTGQRHVNEPKCWSAVCFWKIERRNVISTVPEIAVPHIQCMFTDIPQFAHS